MKVQGSTLEINNHINIFIWVFTVIWTIFACIFLYLYLKDYNTLDNIAKFAIPIVSIGGIFTLIPFSMSKSILTIIFDNNSNQVLIKKIQPFKISNICFNYDNISQLEIEETKDSEGDPYFELNLIFKNSDFFTIKEGHHKETLEDSMQKLQEFTNNFQSI